MSRVELTPKKVLLFYPANLRSVVIETICSSVKRAGFQVVFLTTCEEGDIHKQLKILGIECYTKVYSSTAGMFNYIRYAFFLRRFCKEHKITTVWSHLQSCNFSAVLAQFTIKARVVIFRHHFHAIIKEKGLKVINVKERVIGNIINRFAREIVVPSSEVYEGMITYEKVSSKKLSIIPYIYNFSLYKKPDSDKVSEIKEKYQATLLVIIASRMIAMKRHMLVLPIISKLIKQHYDIKVMLLDDGEERNILESYVSSEGIDNRVFFLGYQKNIIDYISAADVVVHPSYTEASSSLIKEAGLLEKSVIVCSGVGDFSDYITHEKNGYLVNPGNEFEQFEKYIIENYKSKQHRDAVGRNLFNTIMSTFSADENSIKRYLEKA